MRECIESSLGHYFLPYVVLVNYPNDCSLFTVLTRFSFINLATYASYHVSINRIGRWASTTTQMLLRVSFVMLDIEKHQSYSSHLLSSGDSDCHLQTKLGLYQVFLRIYEQNKDLLNEILELEHSESSSASSATLSYLQGVVLAGTAYIVTNLIGGKTQAIPHTEPQWTIGRDHQKASLVLADPRLSRCHACIAYDCAQQRFHVADLGSTNGTFVNGEQIFNRHYLNDGDRIRLGGLGFTFFTYQILPKATPPDHNASLSSNLNQETANNNIGADGLVPSEKNTYPSNQTPSIQHGQRLGDRDRQGHDDTMVVPTPLRPSR